MSSSTALPRLDAVSPKAKNELLERLKKTEFELSSLPMRRKEETELVVVIF